MEKVPGYRSRPLWTSIAVGAFLLSPIASLYAELLAVGLGHPRHAGVWGVWLGQLPFSTWVVLAAVFASGIGLIFVRAFSLHLTMLALGLVLAHNLSLWMHGPADEGGFRLVLMTVITGFVVGAFWKSEFRRPYLEPRVRWWETAPRFRVDLRVEVDGVSSRILDISRSGALLEGKNPTPVGGKVRLKFPQGFELAAEVVRVTMDNATGLQFKGWSWGSRRSLNAYLRALATDPTQLNR